mgnify:CR=1 FL=1
MNDRMRKGCCRLLTLLLTLVLVIPAYGQETLDALAAAQGCTCLLYTSPSPRDA